MCVCVCVCVCVCAMQTQAPKEKATSTSDRKPSNKNHQQRLETIVKQTTVELRVRHTHTAIQQHIEFHKGGQK